MKGNPKLDLESYVVDIPDFPEEGVIFKDITPLFADDKGFRETVYRIASHFSEAGVDKVVGAEARGFMLGSPVAYELGAGFIPARKPGKLPREALTEEFELEYGTASLSIHKDAIKKGENVLIVDDLVATGGTAIAQANLIKQFGANLVGMGFLLELAFLEPRAKIAAALDTEVFSLIKVN